MNVARPFILRRGPFAIIAILLAVGFGLLAWSLYYHAKKSNEEFILKLGEHALQITIFVLMGAAIKEFIDWRTVEKDRLAKNENIRIELLKRLRDIHLKIMNSKDLMQAHMSAKTWSEQSRELLQRIHELAELYEDLQASPDLFYDQKKISEGIDGMIDYLNLSREEYKENHNHVDEDAKKSHKLEHTVEKYKMDWFKGFIEESQKYKAGYTENLKNAKFTMREQVYKPGLLS